MNAADLTAWFRQKLSFPALFGIIFLLALGLRFWALDLKLFHHDEAVHGWFSYQLLTHGTYVYDPSYHGPFLYYVTAGMFSLFGISDAVGRILPALAGLALIPLVYAIYRLGYLDHRQTLVASLFIAVSPEMVYFSRFLRHDMFQLAFTLLLVVGLLYYHHSGRLRYALVAGLAAGLGMCCKEDMPLTLLIFGIFGIYLLWSGKVRLPPTWRRDAVLSGLVLVGVMLAFYSSFGFHPEVITGRLLDVSYVQQYGIISAVSETGWAQAIGHWFSMHEQCRICGPWFFYIMLLMLYELPIFALGIYGAAQFFSRDVSLSERWESLKRRWGRGRREPTLEEVVQRNLHGLKKRVVSSRQDEFMRFSLFWFVLSAGAYAYIGEKVPWLVIHQLLPLIFVGAYLMTRKKAVIAVASVAVLGLLLWHVAYVPADVNEPIVQVQNSEDLRTVMSLIDSSDKVVVSSQNSWPLPWYYIGEKGDKIQYYNRLLEEPSLLATNADLILTYDAQSYDSLPGYDKTTYRNAYWFSYYDNQNRLLPYFFLRDGPVGTMNFDVFIRNTSAAAAG